MKADLNERQVQRLIIRDCARLFPTVLLAHVPNGAHLHGSAGPLLGDGMRPGFPDLVVLWNYGVGFIEVKRSKGGKVSDVQEAMHATLTGLGHRVVVATSSDEAIAALHAWGAPTVERMAA